MAIAKITPDALANALNSQGAGVTPKGIIDMLNSNKVFIMPPINTEESHETIIVPKERFEDMMGIVDKMQSRLLKIEKNLKHEGVTDYSKMQEAIKNDEKVNELRKKLLVSYGFEEFEPYMYWMLRMIKHHDKKR